MDASVALAWGFPDEGNEYADAALLKLERETMLVPALFALEVANALVMGERRKRLRQAEIRRFVDLLEGLSMVQDVQPRSVIMSAVLAIAREHGLSAYDAAYLELAIRAGAPLATLDKALRAAARKAGVTVYAH
ncbi:MAG TPA: type II toxin-antitoxin system VapC family toxin [Bryobacteraceae bacterium]|nr:type II toxin-antitoxin system VapC family toxin [Bryobacteraceae bacterium]